MPGLRDSETTSAQRLAVIERCHNELKLPSTEKTYIQGVAETLTNSIADSVHHRLPQTSCFGITSVGSPGSICIGIPLSFIACRRYALYCDSDMALPSGLVGSGCEIAHS